MPFIEDEVLDDTDHLARCDAAQRLAEHARERPARSGIVDFDRPLDPARHGTAVRPHLHLRVEGGGRLWQGEEGAYSRACRRG